MGRPPYPSCRARARRIVAERLVDSMHTDIRRLAEAPGLEDHAQRCAQLEGRS